MRVAERRVCVGEPPLPADSRRTMAWDSVATLFAPGPESAAHRLAVTMWCLATLAAPASAAARLVRWRFR
jgi:hypothetical protein